MGSSTQADWAKNNNVFLIAWHNVLCFSPLYQRAQATGHRTTKPTSEFKGSNCVGLFAFAAQARETLTPQNPWKAPNESLQGCGSSWWCNLARRGLRYWKARRTLEVWPQQPIGNTLKNELVLGLQLIFLATDSYRPHDMTIGSACITTTLNPLAFKSHCTFPCTAIPWFCLPISFPNLHPACKALSCSLYRSCSRPTKLSTGTGAASSLLWFRET